MTGIDFEGPPLTPDICGTAVVVVSGGKGGVGKSLVSATMAGHLAAAGRRTLLVDATLDFGDLHVLLGVQPFAQAELLMDGSADPRELLVDVADRLWLLPADSGVEALQGIGPVERARIHRRVTSIFPEFDTVIIDAGTGRDAIVTACMFSSTSLMAVVVPEPSSLTNAYAILKAVHRQVPGLRIDVLVNLSSDREEGAETYRRLASACRRLLDLSVGFVGSVPRDPTLAQHIREGGPLLDTVFATPFAASLGAHLDEYMDVVVGGASDPPPLSLEFESNETVGNGLVGSLPNG